MPAAARSDVSAPAGSAQTRHWLPYRALSAVVCRPDRCDSAWQASSYGQIRLTARNPGHARIGSSDKICLPAQFSCLTLLHATTFKRRPNSLLRSLRIIVGVDVGNVERTIADKRHPIVIDDFLDTPEAIS